MDRAELSSPSVVLASGRTTEQRISVFVRQDSETQRNGEAFSILPAADPGNANISPSSLSFIIPPSDLSVELTEIELEKAEDDPERISTVRAMFTVAGGLQGAKSFVVLPSTDRLIVQDGIITADQDSFSVTMGLEKDAVLNEGETLDLIRIHHLDALRPSARMSAEISAGNDHTCAIRADNRIRCWGQNSGTPRINGSVSGPKTDTGAFLAVSAGVGYTCGVRADNTLRCWGSDADALGFSGVSFTNKTSPTSNPEIKEDTKFLAVSAGLNHTCGIRTDGTAACWGDNRSYHRSTAGQETGQTSPTSNPEIKGDTKFLAVSAGGQYTCGLKIDRTVACWGDDGSGQRNNEPEDDELYFAVSSGNGGSTCALRIDNRIRCWGTGAINQPNADTATFLVVSAIGSHNCALRDDNKIKCWGSDASGSRGGSVRGPSTDPGTFLAVSAGGRHTCAVTTEGKLKCWGSDNRTASPEGFRARISPGTPWLFEKFDDVENIVLEPPFIRLRIRVYLEGALR